MSKALIGEKVKANISAENLAAFLCNISFDFMQTPNLAE